MVHQCAYCSFGFVGSVLNGCSEFDDNVQATEKIFIDIAGLNVEALISWSTPVASEEFESFFIGIC